MLAVLAALPPPPPPLRAGSMQHPLINQINSRIPGPRLKADSRAGVQTVTQRS